MEKPSPSLKDSKVIVITPDQIKKMGLESDVKKAASKAEPDNLILNIRSKLSTLLQPIGKPKPKVVTETKGPPVTYRKIPIAKDGTPMKKINRICMVKDKVVTKTSADKSKSVNPDNKPAINSHILTMRSMLNKKMSAEEEVGELSTESEDKSSKPPQNTTETDQTKTTEPSLKPASNNKIQILSNLTVEPSKSEGKINKPSEEVGEKAIDMETIDFVEDDKLHESKSAVPILHFRNASGAVIELFQETDGKSDEETSASQNTEDSEKREENGSTFDDVDENSSDSDVDRSKFKSYLKYSKFKRTKPVGGVKVSEETVESEQSEQSAKADETENEESKEVEPKMSDEDEAKDIVELKPVPINQRTPSNASSENNKTEVQTLNLNSENVEEEQQASDADGLKPILKRKISAASLSDESVGVPVKRGRGRPPKNSLPLVTTEANSPPKAPTKKVVKKKILLAEDGTPIVRKRGRPPKVESGSPSPVKPKPKFNTPHVKTYSKETPLLHVPIIEPHKVSPMVSKVPSMIKLEIEFDADRAVVVEQTSAEEIDADTVKPIEIPKQSPSDSPRRKRGRPKKSVSESSPPKPTPKPKLPKPTKQSISPKEIVVSRSGRKRKKIDYSAMNAGESNSDDSYAEEDPPSKADISDDDFEEVPIRSSFNRDYEHKVYPAKRKSYKSESDTNEDENKKDENTIEDEELPSETTKESSNTDKKLIKTTPMKETDDTSKTTDDIDKNTDDTDKKSEDIDKNTDDIDKKTDDIDKKTDDIDKKTDDIDKKTDDIDKNTDDISMKTDETPKKPDDTPLKIDDTPKKLDDTPLKIDDTPKKLDDEPLKIDDTPKKPDDTPLKIEETPKKTDDVDKNSDDIPKKTDDKPKKSDDTAKKDTPKRKPGRPRKNPERASSPKTIPKETPSPKKTPIAKKTTDSSLKKVAAAKLPKTVAASTTRKGRASSAKKPKLESDNESEHQDTTEEETKPQVQSRKKEMSVDAAFACMFNMVAKETDGPHPINVYARTDFSSKAPPAEDRGTVVCAICEAEVPIKSFSGHNLTKHNNLAWRIGDAPLNLANYGVVLGIYSDMYKVRENFVCDRKCGFTRKSIMGYLSHYIVCQKSAEEVDDMKKPCESCGRLMMPFYYVNHLKDCKSDLPDETKNTRKTFVKHKFQHHVVPVVEPVPTLSIPEVLGHMLNVIKANKSGVNAINVYLRMDLEDLEKREPPSKGQDICALCNMEMKSNKFESHNLTSHNNLSWKIGQPKLDLDKYDSVVPTLNSMYHNRQSFICEQCSMTVKSVWGFLWHVATCGKNPEEVETYKLKCPKCDILIVPTNYSSHTKTCLTKVKQVEESDTEPKLGKKKQRAAATKASQFIHHLTVEDEKCADDDLLNFFHVDHKFFKSRKLVEFMQRRKKHHRADNCIFEGCDYKNEDDDLLTCHLFACLKKPKKNFTCKVCFEILKTELEATAHMHDQHKEQMEHEESSLSSSSSSDDEKVDEVNLERRRKSRIRREYNEDIELTPWELLRIQDLQLYKVDYKSRVQYTITKEFSSTFPVGYGWNLEFVKQNFSLRLYSFCDSCSNWKSVLPCNIASYLPKLRTSIDAAFVKTDPKPIIKSKNAYEWISLKLFEAQRTNDSWTLFCGGPVHSMVWAPIYSADIEEESKLYDQYLAISVLADPDQLVKQGQINAKCSLVQLWNFGPLKVEKSMFEIEDFKPHLEYCLAHKHGDYCCMEWCPSGGFDKNRRLGLLAIGGTDSFVHIYEMPLGNALHKQGSIIFEAQPKYKLECMKLNEMEFSEKQTIPTSISWTKAKDHRYIAVGYCSGLLALFDLLTDSPHLKSVSENDIIVLKPYLVFTAHAAAITALSLHHMHGGNRWIATFSLDRAHRLWDLENYSQPIYNFHKFQMVDGIWPTHWLATIMSYDDVATKGRGGSTGIFFPIKRFSGTYFHFYNYFTRTNSIAVSDWSNMIAYSNVIGHIMGSFVNTCIPTASHGMPALRNFNISFTDVIDKTISAKEKKQKNDIPEEITYAPAKKRYGIIFYDSPINCSRKLEEMRRRGTAKSDMEFQMNGNHNPAMYPLRSATKVAINPNQQAHSYIAVGYQLGFVRIFSPYLYKERKPQFLL